MKKVDIAFIRLNSLRSEPRLIKEYDSLRKQYDCKLLLWNLDKVKEKNPDVLGFNFYLPFGSFWLKPAFILWYFFCFFQLVKIRPAVIHSCDLEANLIASGYKFVFRKTKIIYDIYDVTADKYMWSSDSVKRKMVLAFERHFVKKADYLIIPDESRIDQLQLSKKEKIQLKYEVIYNSIIFKNHKSTKITFKNKSINVVYIGILSKGIRGIEFLIQLAKDFAKVTVVIAGFGADEDLLKDQITISGLPNIEFLGRVSFAEAQNLNSQADIMVSLLDPNFNNYKFASSTKIFDAFANMKPIITTKGTASATIVDAADWGISIGYNYSSLKNAIAEIIDGKISFWLDPRKVRKYDWTLCENKLKAIYSKVLVK